MLAILRHDDAGRWCEWRSVRERADLEVGMDFRRPQFRREVFLRFYQFHLLYQAHPGCVYYLMPYLAETQGWGIEERLWFAFINGNTQNPVTSWIIFNRFPSLRLMHPENMRTLRSWFKTHYADLAFDTDRRHHKKMFPDAVQAYLDTTYGDQQGFFGQFCGFKPEMTPFLSFRRLWDVIMKTFPGFGRLSTFSYLEYLKISGLQLECDRLFLEDLEGSRSHRNGLALVLGRDDLDWHASNPTRFDGSYTREVMGWLRLEGEALLVEAQLRDQRASYFTLESTLCTYKGWHRPNRRYPNVYNDMLHDRIRAAEKRWEPMRMDFEIFWEARRKCLPAHLRLEDCPQDLGCKPAKQNHYRLTGQPIMMHRDWPCFENDYNKRYCP